MKKLLWRVVTGCFIPLIANAAAQPTSATIPGKLDEVQITGHANRLSVMRDRLDLLEDKFNEGYNEANTDHQYDVTCRLEMHTGSRIPSRICRTEFAARAQEEESRALLEGHSAPPASLVILMKWPDYQKNMVAVVRKHPELLELVKERNALVQRLELVRKEKFKGKLVVWD